jgi:hypothetical protein
MLEERLLVETTRNTAAQDKIWKLQGIIDQQQTQLESQKSFINQNMTAVMMAQVN